jgi:hypothetical protein
VIYMGVRTAMVTPELATVLPALTSHHEIQRY